MNISEKLDINIYNEEKQKNGSIKILYDSSMNRNDIYNDVNNNDNLNSSELKNVNREISKNKNDSSIEGKLSFDIKNVLTHAYLPVCIEKMKEGEYMYKWNNNIFQKKTLKFFYLDVNNYCIRWNSKKKKLKVNKNPSLYICDIIKILDGSESLFFKKKEAEKNLSIEIISTHRNLRVTFLDIQRWKMWLFGLMYYQYKLVNKGTGKKMKPFFYENNKLYDNYIISGLKDINVLTLSQLYIILRSLNIYLNMKILYHYFSIYKNKGIINYFGFTKILEHIFSNNHISFYFNIYKDKKLNYIDKNKFIEFLIDIQCEGKCEENIFNNEEIKKFYIKSSLISNNKNENSVDSSYENHEINKEIKIKKIDKNQKNRKENYNYINGKVSYNNKDEKNTNENNFNSNGCTNNNEIYLKSNINQNNYIKNNLNTYDWNLINKIDDQNTNENNIHYDINILNTFLFADDLMHYDEDYLLILRILKNKLKFKENNNIEKKEHNEVEKYDHENYKTEEIDQYEEKKKNFSKENIDSKYFIRARVIYKLLNTIKKYNIPFVIINENHYLTQIGLVYFLLSKENSIMCPEYSKVYQNMNMPLCNYWINSSHNSYLGRKQIFSTSNIEQYIYILIDGCRCVEFDCYYFNKNIVVYHGFYGYKLTSSILFCDTLIACKIFGFTTSPYPIILSLEIHCKNKHKNLIAKILICILGNQLYIPKTRDEINNITPNKCKNKFLAKYKHFDNNESSGFYYIFEGLQSIMYDEISYLSDIVGEDEEEDAEERDDIYDIEENIDEDIENNVEMWNTNNDKKKNMYVNKLYNSSSLERDQEEENNASEKKNFLSILNMKKNENNVDNSINNSLFNHSKKEKLNGIDEKKKIIKKKSENFEVKNNNLLNEYSCLKGYVFRNFCENRKYNEICSISENKFIKLIKKNEKEIIKYNQKTLTRVYPSGTRLASTNFNPLIFWNAGIQVVALNYQYNGLSMLLNKGRFLENGGKHSGYILKPKLLRFSEKNDYNILSLNLQILSLHQINLLFSIKNKYQEKKLKKKLFKMDMIQRIQTHKKINKKMKNFKDLQKLEKEKKNFLFSDIQSDDNKKNVNHEFLLNKFNDNDNDVNYIHNKFSNIEKKYEDMLSEYKSFLLCSSLSHSSSFNSCSSNTTASNNGKVLNKSSSSKFKNKSFYQTFEELKKANNLFFYLYVTISVHGYNEQKYYFKTEIAKVNFYDLNYCWSNPSNFQMKICYPSLALIVFELKAYDTVKSEVIACACFPVKCLREGIRFVPLCDKYLKDIRGSGILVNLKITTNN
ncbi:phosphoinositide-specific phospholipase C, putative [Plasmodium gallinaceum]|uniref:Phosphoinositide phospholipase C n=1 Tax=Plasmodium gallinaceum TaxID=5849 RepID=A0A1J1GNX8_PLAGA|nr:phosphoinositide-specific phospholipase C, putative [Plasmodium gallinaceum]CRG94193.1 phosphoinositide-specific phospholipase C, putative [Plasmodium gallinaceum]